MSEVLQKLLMPWLSQAIGDRGHPYVGGPVVRAADVSHLRTPRALVDALDLRASAAFVDDPPFVDVLRFAAEPLMNLVTPLPVQRPWPTYPMGFLTGPGAGMTPVWTLERTRVPRGAELWRIHADEREELLTVFDGLADGWRGARGYTPPTHLVGPRAVVDGVEYPAELLHLDATQVEVAHVGDDVPPGFRQVRPSLATRRVGLDEVERLHSVNLRCSWLGMRVRALLPMGAETLVLAEQPTLEEVERSRLGEVEPGIYEGVAPRDELVVGEGVDTELPIHHRPAGPESTDGHG